MTKRLVVDIETDGIKHTKIWCICTHDLETKEVKDFINGVNLEDFVDYIKDADEVIGHNFIRFDKQAIKKHLNYDIPTDKITDTLILSKMMNPILDGGHSMEMWATRFFMKKQEHEDWSCFSEEMLKRCQTDVQLNVKIYKYILNAVKSYSIDSIRSEHLIAEIIEEQNSTGVYIDQQKLTLLYAEVCEKLIEIEKELENYFKPIPVTEREVKLKYTKDGKLSKVGLKKLAEQADCVGGDFTLIRWEEFNFGSPKQIQKRLNRIGWKPYQKTVGFIEKEKLYERKKITKEEYEAAKEYGFKISEENLDTIPDTAPESVKKLKIWKVLSSRKSMIEKQWSPHIGSDGRLRGYCDPLGAVTNRMTHDNPNLANIPSLVKKKDENGVEKPLYGYDGLYSYEVRDCFTIEDKTNYVMFGTDASGLELRCLCHYMNDPVYTDIVVNGDPHEHNRKLAGLELRSQAKTFIYACVTMDTTVLTKKGWKTYYEVNVGDLVLTYNPTTKMKEWKPILEKVYYEDAEVIEMSHNHSFKVKTTPNHRWFIKQRKHSRSKKSFARPYMTHTVKTTSEINSHSSIIVNAPYVEDTESTYCFEVKKYGVDWVQRVLDMSSKERQAFIHGFLLADGYIDKFNKWQWNQLDDEIAEGLFTACYLESSSYLYYIDVKSKGMKHCIISAKSHITAQKLKKVKLENQPVWCIRTENESFVMRQGNCVTITGNTLYGGGNAKLGTIIGGSAQDGKALRERFMASLPAFNNLVERVKKEAEKGYITGLDGRRIRVRKPHAALNTLLQSAGAIICKYWLIYIIKLIKKYNVDVKLLLSVHDEYQFEVHKKDVETMKKIVKQSMKMVEKKLKVNVPLDCEYSIGTSWAETH